MRLNDVPMYLSARHFPELGESPVATAVAVLTKFGNDSWNADLYESLSLAARLSMAVKAVKNHGQNIRMSYWLWKINGHAARFFGEVDDIVSGRVAVPVSEESPVTPEKIQSSIDTLMRLGVSLSSVYEEARRRRLLNNSLIAGPVTALRGNADQFFEMAEWLELMLDPKLVDTVFDRANEERSRGEVYDLSQVE